MMCNILLTTTRVRKKGLSTADAEDAEILRSELLDPLRSLHLCGESPALFHSRQGYDEHHEHCGFSYSTITQSLPLRPKTSGEYISSALAGGTTNVPGVVARATYEYS